MSPSDREACRGHPRRDPSSAGPTRTYSVSPVRLDHVIRAHADDVAQRQRHDFTRAETNNLGVQWIAPPADPDDLANPRPGQGCPNRQPSHRPDAPRGRDRRCPCQLLSHSVSRIHGLSDTSHFAGRAAAVLRTGALYLLRAVLRSPGAGDDPPPWRTARNEAMTNQRTLGWEEPRIPTAREPLALGCMSGLGPSRRQPEHRQERQSRRRLRSTARGAARSRPSLLETSTSRNTRCSALATT